MVYLSNEIKAAAMRSRGTRFVSSMSSILCIVNMMNVLKLVAACLLTKMSSDQTSGDQDFRHATFGQSVMCP